MRHHIHIEQGPDFSVAADEDTLLRGALRAGVGAPYECSVGGCGACRFDLVAGEMETLWEDAPGLTARDRKRGKRLACQSRPRGDCTIRLRCGDEYRPQIAPQRRPARLLYKRQLTQSMMEFAFETPDPADFLPGQYALLYPPGVTGARAYSMANLANDEGLWRFIIRRVTGGQAGDALFDRMALGDALTLDGPYGGAYLRTDNARELVCIAGGSGLAPMLSIVRGALTSLPGRRIYLFDGVRSPQDLCAEAALDDTALPDGALIYRPVASDPAAPDRWSGAVGFVHQEVERFLPAPLTDYEFYFAGPPLMADAVQNMLMTGHKVPYQQIHFDRFS